MAAFCSCFLQAHQLQQQQKQKQKQKQKQQQLAQKAEPAAPPAAPVRPESDEERRRIKEARKIRHRDLERVAIRYRKEIAETMVALAAAQEAAKAAAKRKEELVGERKRVLAALLRE